MIVAFAHFARRDRKQRFCWGFLENRHAQDLHHGVKIDLQLQSLVRDKRRQIDADGDPDLRLHGVVAGAVKGFDPQMLLDPFEEQLDLPAAFVESRHGQCREREVVRQEHEPPLVLDVVKRDAAERTGYSATIWDRPGQWFDRFAGR
jgi:hypothetical protein